MNVTKAQLKFRRMVEEEGDGFFVVRSLKVELTVKYNIKKPRLKMSGVSFFRGSSNFHLLNSGMENKQIAGNCRFL